MLLKHLNIKPRSPDQRMKEGGREGPERRTGKSLNLAEKGVFKSPPPLPSTATLTPAHLP